ncbi:YkgJ family cysteine cluster protein [Arenimonas daejeonensis]|uniref:YkgJ family cysteine cluster protein n=1 Tax=Arenimonas daejeonensis TaxID=370777 RepID=UPI0011BFBAFB|nr:YkgJ family cysteine cluster protein [Arenimonas daejeonensis]
MRPLPGATLHLLDTRQPPESPVHCDNCSALCCRLTVVLMPEDHAVPAEFVAVDPAGLRVMARGENGYCMALKGNMCGIYEQRPQACRRFLMAGPYCRAIREDSARGG